MNELETLVIISSIVIVTASIFSGIIGYCLGRIEEMKNLHLMARTRNILNTRRFVSLVHYQGHLMPSSLTLEVIR